MSASTGCVRGCCSGGQGANEGAAEGQGITPGISLHSGHQGVMSCAPCLTQHFLTPHSSQFNNSHTNEYHYQSLAAENIAPSVSPTYSKTINVAITRPKDTETNVWNVQKKTKATFWRTTCRRRTKTNFYCDKKEYDHLRAR